jgi:hypothetical protein
MPISQLNRRRRFYAGEAGDGSVLPANDVLWFSPLP